MGKKSFVIYKDSLKILDEFNGEEKVIMAGKLLLAIKDYQENGELPNDVNTKLLFTPFRLQFERDEIKYNSICDRNKQNALSRHNKNKKVVEPEQEKKPQLKEKVVEKKKKIPELEEFVSKAEELMTELQLKKISIKFIENKFKVWADNDWRTLDKNRDIKNWKSTLRNSIIHWNDDSKTSNNKRGKEIGYSRSQIINQN